jgi:hypothetical protein
MLTERSIQIRLFQELALAHLPALPNYTPAGWFECDLFSVTKAGYFHEHEIKLTAGDFRKDAEKEETVYPIKWGEASTKRSKHGRISAGDVKGPARFWYVMPQAVADKVEIPAFAGLKIAKADD